MKTNLYNIFKTTNAMALIKATLKVLYGNTIKIYTLKRTIDFSWVVQFLTTLNFSIILTKSMKLLFLQSPF